MAVAPVQLIIIIIIIHDGVYLELLEQEELYKNALLHSQLWMLVVLVVVVVVGMVVQGRSGL